MRCALSLPGRVALVVVLTLCGSLLLSSAASALPQVPQAGSGSMFPTGTDAPAGGQTWDIVASGGGIVATSGSPNGWSVGPAGSAFLVSAPGSALLGTYEWRYKSGPSSFASAFFDTVQPAASLFSGSTYPWEAEFSVPSLSSFASSGKRVSPVASHQINSVNGNKLTAIPIVGWTARGGLPVSLSLVHNSESNQNLTLGYKWTHTFDIYGLVDGSGNFTVHWGDDLSYKFTKSGSNYTAPAGIFDKLVKNGDNTYTLTKKNQVKVNFNTALRCTSIQDTNGNTITLGYTGNLVTSITDPTSRAITISYTSNRISTITDPLNRVWTMHYDGSGNLSSVDLPVINSTTYSYVFTYSATHNITDLATPRGKHWTFGYFADNSLQWAKDPYNNQTTFNYTTTTKTVTDPNSKQTVFTYDSSGRVTQEKDALNYHTDYSSYTSNNQPQTITDRRGYNWAYTYDSQGNVLTAKDPYLNTTTYTYNSHNFVLTVTNPLNHTTTYGYDAQDNLTSVTDALNHATTYTYDGNGLQLTTTDALNHQTTYGYNVHGHLTSVTDALTHQTTYDYNLLGRLTSITDALSHQTTYSYDNWLRLSTIATPAGTTTYAYDADNNSTSVTDPNSHATTATYDNANRLLTVTKGNGDTVTYAYDGIGQKGLLSSKTDGNNHTTTYTYTSRNELASASYPDSTSESWTYNANGDKASHTDCKGQLILYSYDNASRQTLIDYPTGTDTSFSYDNASRLTGMTDSTGTTSYSYDSADKLTQITAPNGTTSYTYDNANRLTQTTLTGTGNWTYTYDNADRLLTVTNPNNETATYGYDNANRLTSLTNGNGSLTSYVYDNADRITDVWHKKSDLTVKAHYSYGYDAASNVTSRTDTDGSVTAFGYDMSNQLTSEVRTGSNAYSISYTYDHNGNRLTKVLGGVTTNYTYNAHDKLQTAGSKSYGYDNNGNCTGVTVGGQTTTLTYDYENRVTSITYPGGATNTFQYNGLDLRTRKVDSTGTFNYATDGTGPGSPVLKDGAAVYTPGLSERRGVASKFYHADALGSTRGITDSTQTVTDSILYDAFGMVVSRTGTTPTPFGFVGGEQYQTDTDSGLMLLGHRYYDASVGRFISQDPIGDGDN